MGLENKQSSFDALSDLIRQEQKSAKEHVTEEIHQYQRDLEQDEYCRKYLDSLSFPGIRARQEVIVDPYKETFQWIFDDSGKAVRPWGNFVEWLKNGQGIYWIQGKAGSGKSTLMSYICGDQRTKVLLKTWAGTHELLVIPFFFWKAGKDSPMQKSSAGLLRSLLYQILEKLPHLILSLAQNNRDLQDFKTNLQRFALIPAWTEKHLLTTFQKLLVELSSSYHLCLFIDGLDEIDGSQNDLAELLQDRVSGPNLKICLSSRPDRFFIDAFSSPTMLRLEDVTRKDIILYVSSKLQGACRKKPWVVDDEKWVSLMTATIVQKARGVFQWVRIVVEYQIQGLQSKDSLKKLQERVELLPDEIEELYAHMLERIDKVHREEVASYLQIILQVYRTPSISEIALALYEGRDGLFSPQSTLPLVEIASQCTSVRERIKLICAGLLEFRDQPDHAKEQKNIGVELANVAIESDRGESTFRPNAYERAKSAFLYNWTTRVHLIHRTAYDFLRDNPAGKEFLKSNISSTFDVYRSYIEARLAQLVIFAQIHDSYPSPSTPKSMTSHSSNSSVASLDPPESIASLRSRSSVASLPGSLGPHVTNDFKSDIYAIMKFASFVERLTKVAQTALNDRIDKVVTMLDQQYFHQPPDTHWCTRWGFPSREVDSLRRLGPYDPSLRASSNEPSHDIQYTSTVPLDFLSFAAYHGLYLYVLDTLSTRFEQDDPDRMTILLRVIFHERGFATARGFELGVLLLKRGANPNVLGAHSGPGATIWISFLEYWMYYDVWHRDSVDAIDELPTEKQLTLAARTFIESGADVNATFYSYYTDPFSWMISGDVSTELKRFKGAGVYATMSVLAFFQDAIVSLPDFAEIRKMCVARGASWTSRSVFIRRKDDVRTYLLSKRQSDDVDKLIIVWSSQRAGRPVSAPLDSLRTVLMKLHDELEIMNDEQIKSYTSVSR